MAAHKTKKQLLKLLEVKVSDPLIRFRLESYKE